MGGLEAALTQLQRAAGIVAGTPGPDQLEIIGTTPLPAAAITTDKLKERTVSIRAGWNNWANPARLGRVRSAPQAVSREW